MRPTYSIPKPQDNLLPKNSPAVYDMIHENCSFCSVFPKKWSYSKLEAENPALERADIL